LATLAAIGMLAPSATAQRVVELDSIEVRAQKFRMADVDLYPGGNESQDASIGGFYALEVYREGIGNEIWSSRSACLQVNSFRDSTGASGLALKWDKLADGCPPWLGLGIGWDAWAPKNMEEVVHRAALNIRIKSLEGTPRNVPVAFALEDYSGAQCWLGFQSKYLKKPGLSAEEWNELTLPLEDFEWERSQAQPAQIKQLIIQFEARGNMAIDHMAWVNYPGNAPHRWIGSLVTGGGGGPNKSSTKPASLFGQGPSAGSNPSRATDPSADSKPSADSDHSANSKPSADSDPSANSKPSADSDPSADPDPSADSDPSADPDPSPRLAFVAVPAHQELLLLEPFTTFPPGKFTLSALPEPARIRRRGKLSDYHFDTETVAVKRDVTRSADGCAAGIPCLRVMLSREKHPGILKNQSYYLSFEESGTHPDRKFIWGILQAVDDATQ
jgi:hypothetical protein